jgi:hypothetical protein
MIRLGTLTKIRGHELSYPRMRQTLTFLKSWFDAGGRRLSDLLFLEPACLGNVHSSTIRILSVRGRLSKFRELANSFHP